MTSTERQAAINRIKEIVAKLDEIEARVDREAWKLLFNEKLALERLLQGPATKR